MGQGQRAEGHLASSGGAWRFAEGTLCGMSGGAMVLERANLSYADPGDRRYI